MLVLQWAGLYPRWPLRVAEPTEELPAEVSLAFLQYNCAALLKRKFNTNTLNTYSTQTYTHIHNKTKIENHPFVLAIKFFILVDSLFFNDRRRASTSIGMHIALEGLSALGRFVAIFFVRCYPYTWSECKLRNPSWSISPSTAQHHLRTETDPTPM